MSFKHYFYLYLNQSKHANSFYKFYQTDRRGSSLFIPLDYEWILLNLLKSNHIFILCHVLLVILLSWDCLLLTNNSVTRNICFIIFGDEHSEYIFKAVFILV